MSVPLGQWPEMFNRNLSGLDMIGGSGHTRWHVTTASRSFAQMESCSYVVPGRISPITGEQCYSKVAIGSTRPSVTARWNFRQLKKVNEFGNFKVADMARWWVECVGHALWRAHGWWRLQLIVSFVQLKPLMYKVREAFQPTSALSSVNDLWTDISYASTLSQSTRWSSILHNKMIVTATEIVKNTLTTTSRELSADEIEQDHTYEFW